MIPLATGATFLLLLSLIIGIYYSPNAKYSVIIRLFCALYDLYIDTSYIIILALHITDTKSNYFYYLIIYCASIIISAIFNGIFAFRTIGKALQSTEFCQKWSLAHKKSQFLIKFLTLFDLNLVSLMCSMLYFASWSRAPLNRHIIHVCFSVVVVFFQFLHSVNRDLIFLFSCKDKTECRDYNLIKQTKKKE